MRLRLITLLCATPLTATAGEQISTRVDVYDDGWITVIMPAASAKIEQKTYTISAEGSVDVLSGATPLLMTDAMTSATPFDERRVSGGVSIEVHPKKTWSVGAALANSTESDDRSTNASITFTTDLLDRLATLSLTPRVGTRQTTRAGGKAPVDHTASVGLDGRWSQVVTRTTVLKVLASMSRDACGPNYGCQANPYRYVPMTYDGVLAFAAPEHHPDLRVRGAVGFKVAQSLSQTTAVHAGWRGYADSWALRGHTVKLQGAWSGLDDRLLLKGTARGSIQGAASFYLDTYTTDPITPTAPVFRTADRELAGLNALTLAGSGRWTVHAVGPVLHLKISLRVARTWYRYPDVSELPDRSAWVIGGGLNAAL